MPLRKLKIKSQGYDFSSYNKIKIPKIIQYVTFTLVFFIIFIFLFLILTPWIQTAFGSGTVTAVDPSERVQNISALVKGRIKKWYIHEGDIVKQGDRLVKIIDNDPNYIQRLIEQRDAYKNSYDAIHIATETALLNYNRQNRLFSDGLASKLDVEKSRIDYKKYISELQKAQVMLQQAESKLSQQHVQIIYAPRDGMIIKTLAGDLSTSVKAGDILASLVPLNVEPAVELYIHGIDIALIHKGRKVRLQFEGWPSIQFSGWPTTAIGTFGGVVTSVDPIISSNGRFRIIVRPDHHDKPWPESHHLHYGAKVKGWVLLEKVKLYYEFWRQLNAFPPEYNLKTDAIGDNNKGKKQ
jgi:multidrug efflux pump subunit AcrA (membrane-fusion protein)